MTVEETGPTPPQDWAVWHDLYDDAGSPLGRRLEIVRRMIGRFLDTAPPGPLRAVSVCAGQGRDLIGALARHTRRDDVSARLVELDERNVARGRQLATRVGLEQIELVVGDASTSSAYEGAVPADLVLVCGVFGNLSDADVARTIELLPMLCAPGATVVWTRHRMEPDLTTLVRRWFADAGLAELEFETVPGTLQAVGSQRLTVTPPALRSGVRLFDFVGFGELSNR